MNLKISKRIESIVDLAPGPYDEVWDLCCDHGKIGMHYAHTHAVKTIHFVDQVISITDNLTLQLDTYIPSSCKFYVHTKPAENLQIQQKEKNLFIMAGIGSETIIKILDNFEQQKLLNNHFLISTHKYPHKIRRYLIDKRLKLFEEILVVEGNHFYEMLLVGNLGLDPITMTGEKMWDFNNIKH